MATAAISLAACTSIVSGVGGVLLSRSGFFADRNISFLRAALIGGGSVTASAAVLCAAAFIYMGMVSRAYGSFEKFMKNWTWVGLIPLIGIPYLMNASVGEAITFIALAALAATAKAMTVGILPD